MSDHLEASESSTREEINGSTKRRQEQEWLFINYEMEDKLNQEVTKLRKNIKTIPEAEISTPKVTEIDNIQLEGLDNSVGTFIKNEAIKRHHAFNTLSTNEQTIVSLGLNSILDLSFDYPDGQSKLFTNRQWKHLRKTFKPEEYKTEKYEHIKTVMKPLINSYNAKDPAHIVESRCRKELKKLKDLYYDDEDNEIDRDVCFCLTVFERFLDIIKHQQHLFNDTVDNSEWDYIVKLWGPICEQLFKGTNLRCKWGDTSLHMEPGIVANTILKVDLRVINDVNTKASSKEMDLTVSEAAKEDPGLLKFQSDHCKLMIEGKIINDNLITEDCDIGPIYSLQICGLELLIMSTVLQGPGLYVCNEMFAGSIENTSSKLEHFLTIALHLLIYRDKTVETKNAYYESKIAQKSVKKSVKGPKYNTSTTKGKKTTQDKKSWIRDNWIASRKADAVLSPIPNNLSSS